MIKAQNWENVWVQNDHSMWTTSFIMVNDVYYVSTNKGLFKSIDWGQTWNSTFPFTFEIKKIDYIDGYFYASTLYYGLYRSPDGINWSQCLSGDPLTRGVFKINNVLYVGARTGFICRLYKSTDNGVSWTQEGAAIPGSADARGYSTDGTYIYAAVSGLGIFRYDFVTQIWELKSNGLSDVYVYNVYSSNSLVITDMGIYPELSSNQGESWDKFYKISFGNNFFTSGDTVLFLTSNAVIEGTNDNGLTWFEKTSNNSLTYQYQISKINDTIYAYFYDVWKISYSQMVTSLKEGSQNQVTKISPNPFANEIFISSFQDFDQIILLDNYGRKVIDKQLLSPTNYEELDISNVEKGIYIILLLRKEETVYNEKLIKF